MTYAIHTDRTAGASIWQRLSDLTAGLTQRHAQYRAYRSTVRELEAMSHRDLTDLGIHAGDIHAIAR